MIQAAEQSSPCSEQITLNKNAILGSKRLKKSENPKMTSKVLYELIIRSYEQFQIFGKLEKKSCDYYVLVIILVEFLEKCEKIFPSNHPP